MTTPLTPGTYSNKRAVGTFPTRRAAEEALHELRDSGFVMDRVSVVAKDSTGHGTLGGADIRDRAEDSKADDGAKVGALSGGALGGLTGLLVGLGALAIPGVGPIMLAGAAATALATTVAGGAIGAAAGSLLGGLIGLGIPEDRARIYNDRVSAGEYLVIVDGTQAEIAQAEAILNHRGIQEWGIYDVPATESTTTRQTATTATTPTTSTSPSFKIDRPETKVDRTETPIVGMPGAHNPVAGHSVTSGASGSPTNSETVNLYEERLVVDKDRQKTGEVSIGKHTETESARASVPIEKEHVVIERTPVSGETVVTPDRHAFKEGETVRMEVYEETPDIRKETFIREEVNIRQETTREIVNAEETIRREELDIDTQGNPNLENRSDRLRQDRH